jgi:hypothetical protein
MSENECPFWQILLDIVEDNEYQYKCISFAITEKLKNNMIDIDDFGTLSLTMGEKIRTVEDINELEILLKTYLEVELDKALNNIQSKEMLLMACSHERMDLILKEKHLIQIKMFLMELMLDTTFSNISNGTFKSSFGNDFPLDYDIFFSGLEVKGEVNNGFAP